MEYFGYVGKVLWVDLTSNKIRKEPLDLELAQKFVGGCGFNLRLLYDLLKPGIDPFAPENVILIGAGPLIGTLLPAGKITATLKFINPASEDPTYCYIGSAVGGSKHFGIMLKNAGYDSVIITGKARNPVYLKIFDDDIEVCDARNLWGKKDIYETTDELVGKYGRCGVIAIGLAGENLVKNSMAMVDSNSTLGRNGVGALMGSKNLKAIIVRGTKGVKIADPKRFMKKYREFRKNALSHPFLKGFQEYGLHGGPLGWEIWKVLLNPGKWPVEKWNSYYGLETCKEAIEKIYSCTGCVLGCRPNYKIKNGKFAGQGTRTAHFIHFGSYAQSYDDTDWGNMIKLVDICNRSGISAVYGLTAALFLTNLFERGTVTTEQIDGLKLSHNIESYVNFLEKIAHREGFGNDVADGWFAISKKIGINLPKILNIIKGGLCIYDPRTVGFDPRVFQMVVNPRGAHHPQAHWVTSIPMQPIELIRKSAEQMGMTSRELNRTFSSDDFNVGRLTRHIQDNGMVIDSLGSCILYGMFQFDLLLDSYAEFYSAATGIETSVTELKRNGERAFNMLKLLNVREGFNRKDDVPPDLWFRPRKDYGGKITVLKDYYKRKIITADDIEKAKDDYYEERGWDIKTGIPAKEKLIELGLDEL